MITNNIPQLNHVRDGLQLHYDLSLQNGYNGSTAVNDFSGNGYNAAFSSHTFTPDHGGAIVANGSTTRGGRGSVPDTDKYHLGINEAVSLEVWVRWETLSKANDGSFAHGYIWGSESKRDFAWYLVKHGNFNGPGSWYLSWRVTDGTGRAQMNVYKGHASIPDADVEIQSQTYHHLVCTFDNSAAQEAKMYIDGVLQTHGFNDYIAFSNFFASPSTRKWLSILGNYRDISRTADARFGTYRLYDKELTAAEVAHNYKIQKIRYGK